MVLGLSPARDNMQGLIGGLLVESIPVCTISICRESGYVYTDVTPHGGEKSVKVKLLKSDGSTLYITRDIAAANERYVYVTTICNTKCEILHWGHSVKVR